MKNQSVTNNLDWISVFIYITLVVMGWLNIYSSSLSLSDADNNIFDLSQFYGKQLLSIGLTVPLIFIVLAADGKFYEKFASIIFVIALLSLAGLFVFGKTVKDRPTGTHSVHLVCNRPNLQRRPPHSPSPNT